jgi:adenine/guanine phosphoribosyltransferase-like PRPP-binding protein
MTSTESAMAPTTALPLYLPPPEILSARPYLLDIDRTSRGLGRYELTSFFARPGNISSFIRDVISHFDLAGKLPIDAVVGIDALGFPLAGALAMQLGVGCVLARKRGKIALPPEEVLQTEGFRDYSAGRQGEKGLEIRRDLVREGMRVIVV